MSKGMPADTPHGTNAALSLSNIDINDVKLGRKPRDQKDLLIFHSKDPKMLDRQVKIKAEDDIDLLKAIDYHLKGIGWNDIKAICDPEDRMTKTGFRTCVRRYCPEIDLKELEIYRNTRTAVFNNIEKQTLDLIGRRLKDAIEKGTQLPLKDLKDLHSVIYNNRRLEEDKSTNNVAHKHTSIADRIYKNRQKQDDPKDDNES